MIKLKQILLNIARLPTSDQRWIIQKLPNEQRDRLETCQGLDLLQQAQQFRSIKSNPTITPTDNEPTMPLECLQLMNHAPLSAAIVLEQGNYPWKELCLQQLDSNGQIKQALQCQVPDIKPLVKQMILNDWEQSPCFETYLEDDHG